MEWKGGEGSGVGLDLVSYFLIHILFMPDPKTNKAILLHHFSKVVYKLSPPPTTLFPKDNAYPMTLLHHPSHHCCHFLLVFGSSLGVFLLAILGYGLVWDIGILVSGV